MKYSENAINILTVKTFKGIGRSWIVKNLSKRKSVDEILSLLNGSLAIENRVTLDGFNKNKNKVINALNRSVNYIDGLVAVGDEDFPAFRGNVKYSEQPIFLFYRGNLSLLNRNNNNIAVIGLLNPDSYIENTERMVVSELVKLGATIVSGLALGCDAIAHDQALNEKGKTIAILPSPLSNVIPSKNQFLAEKIVSNNGLVISEYLTDVDSKRELVSRYQERDRLQALFSNCIILTASYTKSDIGKDSGSRLAMGYAENYSIPRAVIYDPDIDIDNPMFSLNRQCLNESREIIVINRLNLCNSVRKVVGKKQISNYDLFD
jgi:DNA processing protein